MGKKNEDQDPLVLLGEITTPYGVKGGVKVKSFTANPDDIVTYSPLYFDDNRTVERKLKRLKSKNEMVMVMIEDIDDRNIVEKMRGTKIYTLKSSLPQLEEEEFYYEDLVGMTVIMDGVKIGEVMGVNNYGAGDILDIRLDAKETISIPFTKEMVPTISVTQGQLTVSQEIKAFYNEKKPKKPSQKKKARTKTNKETEA